MMFLKGLLDRETHRCLAGTSAPFQRLWQRLADWGASAGDMGPLPLDESEIDESDEWHLCEAPVPLARHEIAKAIRTWQHHEAGESAALQSPSLGHVIAALAYLAGTRLGLNWRASVQFGHWLAAVARSSGDVAGAGLMSVLPDRVGPAARRTRMPTGCAAGAPWSPSMPTSSASPPHRLGRW
jgi:hypothetical protein